MRKVRLTAVVAAAVLVGGLSACNQSSNTASGGGGGGADLTPMASVRTNDIAKTAQLLDLAMAEGKRLYGAQCSTCHGADLKGVPDQHTPDLTDNEWLYIGDDQDSGGVVHTAADVEKTVRLGIRAMPKVTNLGSQQENDAKNFEIKNLAIMPPMTSPEYGLTDAEVADVAEYVLQLGGQEHNQEMAMRGKAIYDEKGSCYDCHDPEGIGDPSIGSTNLTMPSLYLYGSTREAILTSLKMGRSPVMPAFEGKLKPEEIKALAVYVFAQGGPGSATP